MLSYMWGAVGLCAHCIEFVYNLDKFDRFSGIYGYRVRLYAILTNLGGYVHDMLEDSEQIWWRTSAVSMVGISNSARTGWKPTPELDSELTETELEPELELNFD